MSEQVDALRRELVKHLPTWAAVAEDTLKNGLPRWEILQATRTVTRQIQESLKIDQEQWINLQEATPVSPRKWYVRMKTLSTQKMRIDPDMSLLAIGKFGIPSLAGEMIPVLRQVLLSWEQKEKRSLFPCRFPVQALIAPEGVMDEEGIFFWLKVPFVLLPIGEAANPDNVPGGFQLISDAQFTSPAVRMS